ncbi:MAG TPA: ribonuclease P protein component [Candidatus Methylomirabilis sp.]|nr:ribonuclease P protein component [Candidatus Methylomirabilis sp.]
MRKRATATSRLRGRGARVTGGPWTLCGDRAHAAHGRLILALGRAAGTAVTRSRIRRIAREVLGRGRTAAATDLLLLARSDVSRQPRRQVRASLADLLQRLSAALERREEARRATHG